MERRPSDKGQLECFVFFFFFPRGWRNPNQAAINSSYGQRQKETSGLEKEKKKKSYVAQQVEHDR